MEQKILQEVLQEIKTDTASDATTETVSEAITEAVSGAERAQTCCCERKKKRSEEEYKRLTNRLSRIEGQIRGIRGMLEKDAYCPDILTQAAAANAALNAFCRELLSSHIRSCVAEDIRQGRDETIDELLGTLQKLMK